MAASLMWMEVPIGVKIAIHLFSVVASTIAIQYITYNRLLLRIILWCCIAAFAYFAFFSVVKQWIDDNKPAPMPIREQVRTKVTTKHKPQVDLEKGKKEKEAIRQSEKRKLDILMADFKFELDGNLRISNAIIKSSENFVIKDAYTAENYEYKVHSNIVDMLPNGMLRTSMKATIRSIQIATDALKGLHQTTDYGYIERRNRVKYLIDTVNRIILNENAYNSFENILEVNESKLTYQKE